MRRILLMEITLLLLVGFIIGFIMISLGMGAALYIGSFITLFGLTAKTAAASALVTTLPALIIATLIYHGVRKNTTVNPTTTGKNTVSYSGRLSEHWAEVCWLTGLTSTTTRSSSASFWWFWRYQSCTKPSLSPTFTTKPGRRKRDSTR